MKHLLKKTIYYLAAVSAFRTPRSFFSRFVKGVLRQHNKEIVAFPKDFFKLFLPISAETQLLMSCHNSFLVYLLAKASSKIDGDIAEVGVFRGGSAKLIAEVKGNKSLHLFDTFSGLPEANDIDIQDDGVRFNKGDFISDINFVKNLFANYPRTFIYPGIFPQTAEKLSEKKFCFVHIDVDTHRSTRSALDFFYPRMSRGGLILCHDYPTANGVVKAVDEFFKDKTEAVIQVSNQQCLIVRN